MKVSLTQLTRSLKGTNRGGSLYIVTLFVTLNLVHSPGHLRKENKTQIWKEVGFVRQGWGEGVNCKSQAGRGEDTCWWAAYRRFTKKKLEEEEPTTCPFLESLGLRWVEKTHLPKAARGVLTLPSKVPVFDVFLALTYAHPVLAGPLWRIQQGWNKALYCGTW